MKVHWVPIILHMLLDGRMMIEMLIVTVITLCTLVIGRIPDDSILTALIQNPIGLIIVVSPEGELGHGLFNGAS